MTRDRSGRRPRAPVWKTWLGGDANKEMSTSHSRSPEPSPVLALIALAIVHRLRPSWCAIGLAAAATSEGVRPERLSRLCTTAIEPFEAIVRRLTAIGRPRSGSEEATAQAELLVARSLLEAATAVLRALGPWRRAVARQIVVSAWLRIQKAHPELGQKTFAAALALSPRTLRSWLSGQLNASAERLKPTPPPPKKRPPKRRLRRPRFLFDLHVPGIQFAGDTTDLELFGTRLKLIGIQDVGGRDRSLLDSVLIDDHESAALVGEAATKALRDFPGAQFLTDQGTPYMAEKLSETLAALEVEHAPQKEGDPQGKATLERAFGTIKPILAPLAELTNLIANAIPQLRETEFAKACARVLVTPTAPRVSSRRPSESPRPCHERHAHRGGPRARRREVPRGRAGHRPQRPPVLGPRPRPLH